MHQLGTPPATTAVDLGPHTVTATCDHPLRIRFHAGDGTAPVTINGTDYLVNLVAHRDNPGDTANRRSIDLGSGWSVWSNDAGYALTHPNGIAATDDAQQAFCTHLPALRRWLAGPDARTLVIEGTARWRQTCQHWATDVEADLDAARAHIHTILGWVTAGELLSATAEHYLRHARVHPRPTSLAALDRAP